MYTSDNKYQIIESRYDPLTLVHIVIMRCECGCIFENRSDISRPSLNKSCPDCAERERIQKKKLGKEIIARMDSLMRETDTEEALLLSDPSREEWKMFRAFQITYKDPETEETKIVVRPFEDTAEISARDHANAFAYNISDKGDYSIKEFTRSNIR